VSPGAGTELSLPDANPEAGGPTYYEDLHDGDFETVTFPPSTDTSVLSNLKVQPLQPPILLSSPVRLRLQPPLAVTGPYTYDPEMFNIGERLVPPEDFGRVYPYDPDVLRFTDPHIPFPLMPPTRYSFLVPAVNRLVTRNAATFADVLQLVDKKLDVMELVDASGALAMARVMTPRPRV
jgi:hypothetical protein